MSGIIPLDEIRRLQKRMNKLMEDLGLSDLESKYLDEMQRIQKRISNLMEEYDTSRMETNIMMPLADMKETDESIVVTMDLPGVNKEDVDIAISDDELRVVAERQKDTERTEKDYHKHERTYTKFERMIKLPISVKAEDAKAKLTDGVLEITLPKEVITSRKRINID